jgi:hypothetical protein
MNGWHHKPSLREALSEPIVRLLTNADHVVPQSTAPFFWSQHYDVPINYVGHTEKWDEIKIDGDAAKNWLLRYMHNGRALAVASKGDARRLV